jgi:hypothetical protein
MLLSPISNENGVLVALPSAVRALLVPSLKRVRLEAGDTLFREGRRWNFVSR